MFWYILNSVVRQKRTYSICLGLASWLFEHVVEIVLVKYTIVLPHLEIALEFYKIAVEIQDITLDIYKITLDIQ